MLGSRMLTVRGGIGESLKGLAELINELPSTTCFRFDGAEEMRRRRLCFAPPVGVWRRS